MMHSRILLSASSRLYLRRSVLPTSTTFTSHRPAARHFSDNLLGHSPMAQSSSSSSSSSSSNKTSAIPTAQDVTTAGGVWAPTSAKRDALGELKAAAATGVLDDEATAEEKLDLYLADGIQLIGKTTDQMAVTITNSKDKEDSLSSSVSLATWWEEQQQTVFAKYGTNNSNDTAELAVVPWEEVLKEFCTRTDAVLATLAADQYLQDVRDYMEPTVDDKDWESFLSDKELEHTTSNFENAVMRFRLLLAKAAAEHLLESWPAITTVSDQDVDRAAVQGETAPVVTTVPAEKLKAVLRSFLLGTCSDRIDALWDLVDWDNDGLLDEDGMNLACEMAVRPVGAALEALLQDALEAAPVRELPAVVVEEGEKTAEEDAPATEADEKTTGVATEKAVPPKMGWRKRRKEKKIKKKLTKMFKKTVKNHFRDEVEMSHRLRCIYAWSNKKHQNNEIDSVLVDESGWSGRKRYVELHPKISLSEFREVQSVHLTHLDRLSEEFLKSYREDLLVKQGKGRQNAELMRECTMFLVVVSLVDYVIVCL